MKTMIAMLMLVVGCASDAKFPGKELQDSSKKTFTMDIRWMDPGDNEIPNWNDYYFTSGKTEGLIQVEGHCPRNQYAKEAQIVYRNTLPVELKFNNGQVCHIMNVYFR